MDVLQSLLRALLVAFAAAVASEGCASAEETAGTTGEGGGANGGDDAGSGGGNATTGASCSSDADCGGNTPVCRKRTGHCVECTSDADCPARCELESGRCVECVLYSDCSSGQACEAEQCVAGVACSSDADCEATESYTHCVGSVCVECIETSDCGAGVCRGYQCRSVACSDDSQCEVEERCVDSRCRGCSHEVQCPVGYYCAGGQCTIDAACSTDADCAPLELTCHSTQGYCKECESEADCPSGYACVEGICAAGLTVDRGTPAVPTGGSGALELELTSPDGSCQYAASADVGAPPLELVADGEGEVRVACRVLAGDSLFSVDARIVAPQVDFEISGATVAAGSGNGPMHLWFPDSGVPWLNGSCRFDAVSIAAGSVHATFDCAGFSNELGAEGCGLRGSFAFDGCAAAAP